jgi:hypothetical protein
VQDVCLISDLKTEGSPSLYLQELPLPAWDNFSALGELPFARWSTVPALAELPSARNG